jgi:hypothetical protein
LVVMMMVTTFTAVATPHALVLTISHDLLFRQPLFALRRNALFTERHFPWSIAHCRSPRRDGIIASVRIADAAA